MNDNSVGKRPLGRPRLGWEDVIIRDVEAPDGGLDWKVQVADRGGWRIGCVMGWS